VKDNYLEERKKISINQQKNNKTMDNSLPWQQINKNNMNVAI